MRTVLLTFCIGIWAMPTLLAQAGIASPSGPMTVAPVRGISGIALGKNGKLS